MKCVNMFLCQTSKTIQLSAKCLRSMEGKHKKASHEHCYKDVASFLEVQLIGQELLITKTANPFRTTFSTHLSMTQLCGALFRVTIMNLVHFNMCHAAECETSL